MLGNIKVGHVATPFGQIDGLTEAENKGSSIGLSTRERYPAIFGQV